MCDLEDTLNFPYSWMHEWECATFCLSVNEDPVMTFTEIYFISKSLHALWVLVLSVVFQLDWSQVVVWFIFFIWTQGRVSMAVCLGSLSHWNVNPRFIFIILVDGSRFLSRMSQYIFPFIFPSIIWKLKVWCVLWLRFCSHLTRLHSTSISPVGPDVVQQTLNKLQRAFSSAVNVHTGHLLFSLKQLYTWWKFHVNSTFINTFTEKNGEAFYTLTTVHLSV